MSTEQLSQIPTTSTDMETDLYYLDRIFDNTLEKRNRIINKLETAVMLMELDINNEDPELLSSKLKAIETYNTLLNDQEKNVDKRATIKMKKKDLDNKISFSLDITGILKQLSSITTNQESTMRAKLSPEEYKDLLDKSFLDRGCVIIEEERSVHHDTDITSKQIEEYLEGTDTVSDENIE